MTSVKLTLSQDHIKAAVTAYLKTLSMIDDDETVEYVYEGHESDGRHFYVKVVKE